MGNIHHLSTTHYQNNSVAFQFRIFAAITFKTTFSPPEKKLLWWKTFPSSYLRAHQKKYKFINTCQYCTLLPSFVLSDGMLSFELVFPFAPSRKNRARFPGLELRHQLLTIPRKKRFPDFLFVTRAIYFPWDLEWCCPLSYVDLRP